MIAAAGRGPPLAKAVLDNGKRRTRCASFFVWWTGTLNRMACLRSFNTNECGKAPDKRIGKNVSGPAAFGNLSA
jgi:hypothetical protein